MNDIINILQGDKPVKFQVGIETRSIIYLCSGILITALLIILAARLTKK